MSERALRVLRKEAEKYSEVRSRLATAEGLHAAALFQEGLKQATLPGQSPVQGKPQQTLGTCDACGSLIMVAAKIPSCCSVSILARVVSVSQYDLHL